MVGALLRDVRNKRSTASDAADSGLSPLSGDQNQGETHATPEQTEVGTPPRAAANRPVRRERADHRRHAGLVRPRHGNDRLLLGLKGSLNEYKTAVAAGYDGTGVKVKIRRKARSDWLALMPNAHEGYISAGTRPKRSARWSAAAYPPAVTMVRPSTATLCWRACCAVADAGVN